MPEKVQKKRKKEMRKKKSFFNDSSKICGEIDRMIFTCSFSKKFSELFKRKGFSYYIHHK